MPYLTPYGRRPKPRLHARIKAALTAEQKAAEGDKEDIRQMRERLDKVERKVRERPVRGEDPPVEPPIRP